MIKQINKLPKKSKKKKKVRGGSPLHDSWSIDWAFMKWVLPRLKLLEKRDIAVRSQQEKEDYKYMIKVFANAKVNHRRSFTAKEVIQQAKDEKRAIKLFAKHFHGLWD